MNQTTDNRQKTTLPASELIASILANLDALEALTRPNVYSAGEDSPQSFAEVLPSAWDREDGGTMEAVEVDSFAANHRKEETSARGREIVLKSRDGRRKLFFYVGEFERESGAEGGLE